MARSKNRMMFAVLLVILGALVLIGSRLGFFGFIGVSGNSMSSVYPEGSRVVVVPATLFPPKEGDDVVAYYQGGESLEDSKPSLIIKRLQNGQLIGVDDGSKYPAEHIRAKVIACIPLQEILWWTNKGIQVPVSKKLQASPEDRERVIQARNMRLQHRLQLARTETHKKKLLVFTWESCRPMKKTFSVNQKGIKAIYVKVSVDAEVIVTLQSNKGVRVEEEFLPQHRTVVFFSNSNEQLRSYGLFIDGYGSKFCGETGVFVRQ